VIVLGVIVAGTVKLKTNSLFLLSSVNQKRFTVKAVEQYLATVITGCDKQVCTHDTLWRQHYITSSKANSLFRLASLPFRIRKQQTTK